MRNSEKALIKLAKRLGYEIIYTESGDLTKYNGNLLIRKSGKFFTFNPLNNAEQSQEIMEFILGNVKDGILYISKSKDGKLYEIEAECLKINLIVEASGKTLQESVLNCGLKVIENE